MNLHDILISLWRLAAGSGADTETGLETAAKDFQDTLFEYNKGYGEDEFVAQGGTLVYSGEHVIDSPYRDYAPYTVSELDAIRHYYGQKLALETESSLIALGAPYAHEIVGRTGLFSPHWEESAYDVYVNAVAAKDYYKKEGPSGSEFFDMLKAGGRANRLDEFMDFGDAALARVPAGKAGWIRDKLPFNENWRSRYK